MDSGPFLDVIPLVLKYLDFESLIQLSQTCHFWRNRIYLDLKLWPKTIALPYSDTIGYHPNSKEGLDCILEAKLWSAIFPPKDPEALEHVLHSMARSEESIGRFRLVTKVWFSSHSRARVVATCCKG